MALRYGILLPQGWRMDLVDIKDPVEAYETLTRVVRRLMRSAMIDIGWSTSSIQFPGHHKK